MGRNLLAQKIAALSKFTVARTVDWTAPMVSRAAMAHSSRMVGWVNRAGRVVMAGSSRMVGRLSR